MSAIGMVNMYNSTTVLTVIPVVTEDQEIPSFTSMNSPSNVSKNFTMFLQCAFSSTLENILYSLLLIAILFGSFVGNLFVVVAVVLSRQLRSRVTTYFIVSLGMHLYIYFSEDGITYEIAVFAMCFLRLFLFHFYTQALQSRGVICPPTKKKNFCQYDLFYQEHLKCVIFERSNQKCT